MRPYEQLILKPIITEKTTRLKSESVYVFSVMPDASKIDIKNAIQGLFKVDVVEVNTVNSAGKKRQTGRSIGRTARVKKAYIKLKSGQKIDLLEGML